MAESPLDDDDNELPEDFDIFDIDRFGKTDKYHKIPSELEGISPLQVLQKHSEQMPALLGNVTDADLGTADQFRDTLNQFLGERVAFYPGAGTDWQLFSTFGKSGSVHCFVHADLGIEHTEDILAILQGAEIGRIRGYDPVVHRVIPAVWWPQFEPPSGCNRESKPLESLFVILKRQDGFPDAYGPKYFGFLHVSVDAYWLYWALWGRHSTAPHAVLLQDHTQGRFGGDENPLFQMATQAGLPEFLLVAKNTKPWPGYDVVSGWSEPAGMGGHGRCLYQRKHRTPTL